MLGMYHQEGSSMSMLNVQSSSSALNPAQWPSCYQDCVQCMT